MFSPVYFCTSGIYFSTTDKFLSLSPAPWPWGWTWGWAEEGPRVCGQPAQGWTLLQGVDDADRRRAQTVDRIAIFERIPHHPHQDLQEADRGGCE